MKKKKQAQILRSIADGKTSERYPVGASACNRCICQSCTGFGCPWVSRFWRYSTEGYKYASRRCNVCDFKMIYDCDFYTNHRRKRFFVLRKYVFKETKLDRLIKSIEELKKQLLGKPPT